MMTPLFSDPAQLPYSCSKPALPSPASAQIWLDFDGTITRQDVLDRLIVEFAVNDSWKLIEERWQAGLIGSYQCLREEFALVRIRPARLRRFLDAIPVDPGFEPLMILLGQFEVPTAILSDGIDTFIQRILGRQTNRALNGAARRLTIRANAIEHKGQSLELHCPHASPACESAAAHCKCASAHKLRRPGRRTIYVGDGRSDLCPARKADCVFAKGTLAQSLQREGRPFYAYESLMEVASVLAKAWHARDTGKSAAI